MSKFVVVKRSMLLVLTGIAVVVIVAVTAVIADIKVSAGAKQAVMTVVIDAGHGGIDNGVVGENTGATESELNLSVAKLLRDDFKSAGFRVIMTRTSSAALYGAAQSSLKKTDMQNRKKIIEDADAVAVISLHMNKCPLPSRRGAQVFYKIDDDSSESLAGCVQKSLDGMEESSRSCPILKGDYYVLNVSPCPAILVECGFLSNSDDEALLTTEEYRSKLAYTVFKGTVDYLTRGTVNPFVGGHGE